MRVARPILGRRNERAGDVDAGGQLGVRSILPLAVYHPHLGHDAHVVDGLALGLSLIHI